MCYNEQVNSMVSPCVKNQIFGDAQMNERLVDILSSKSTWRLYEY